MTRIIEQKWFEFGKDENGNDLPKMIISKEYSSDWKLGDEPITRLTIKRIMNDINNIKLTENEDRVIFDGRLGEYKYYDMDATVDSVLSKCKKEFSK